MSSRPHLATLVLDMRQLGSQAAVVEHRGVRRFSSSYAQLAQGAAWFAAELQQLGIAPGERVVLWGENSAAWIACFFGCVMRGVLVVPLDASGTLAFAERVIHETSPRLVAGDPVLVQQLAPTTKGFELPRLLAPMQPSVPAPLPGQANQLTQLDRLIVPGLSLDSPLQILFTSGTTGEPRGIVHTHGNLLASLGPIESEITKYRRYERFVHPLHILHTLPLSHVFGQFMGLWVAPVLGAVVHYDSRLEAARLLRVVRQERISVLAAVPRVLALLRAELLVSDPGLAQELIAAEGQPLRARWWRFRGIHRRLGLRFWAIVCGGATLPAELESFWVTLGVALIQGYGMTETSALVTLNHPFKPARGTLGAPLPGRELRIADNGELLVRGAMVANTTWRGGALQSAPPDTWLPTGDLAQRDAEGRLHFLGRTGERLVTAAGLNVYLQDLESALAAQPGVRAALAVTLNGAQGPEPGAVLCVAEPALAEPAVNAANASLAAYQRITRWWVWPGLDLPRTATGKVRRNVVDAWVRERLAAEPLPEDQPPPGAAASTTLPPDDLLLALISQATGVPASLGRQRSAAEQDLLPLESFGVDSLARVQVQAALERAGARTIDDQTMAEARTLGDLRRIVGLPNAVAAEQEQEPIEPPPTSAGPAQASRGDPNNTPPRRSQPETGAQLPTQADPPREPAFLYLRWPWSAPFQGLRALFLELVVHPLVWLLAAPRVVQHGNPRPRQATHGPVLIVANHVSSFDVPLLLYALPRHMRVRVAVAAAGEMLEDWRHARSHPLGPAIFWLLTVLFNAFPLPRSRDFRRSFEHAGAALDHGYSVLLFPEGTRSGEGPMQPFRGGIGLLALDSSVEVLPVALEQSRSRAGLRPYAATVHLDELLIIVPGETARSITSRLERAVRAMLPPVADNSQETPRLLM